MTVTRSGLDTTTGQQHQTSCLKSFLRELTSFSWAFFQLYFFLLKAPYSLRVYLLLATRFLVYTLEAISYYALVATLISNAGSNIDPGFLVEMTNVLLDCHPSVGGNRMRRSAEQMNTTSKEDRDFLKLLQNFDKPEKGQELTTTPEPVTTDQSSTAHLLPVSSPWTAGPHWMYYTPNSSSPGEAQTTSPYNGSSTFHSWLLDLSNRTTSPPTLFEKGDGFFMWPLIALLTAFITGFLVGCILGCCRPTCVTRKTYTTTYVRQLPKEKWTPAPEALWTDQPTLPPTPVLHDHDNAPVPMPLPAPPIHLGEVPQLSLGTPTNNI